MTSAINKLNNKSNSIWQRNYHEHIIKNDESHIKIADYIVQEQTHQFAPCTIHHAKRAVIDWFAAMYSGSVQDPNPMLRAAFIDTGDPQHAIVFPTGDHSTIKTAAFLNGASAHTSEFDDIFRDGGLHPGCSTIAAAQAGVALMSISICVIPIFLRSTEPGK